MKTRLLGFGMAIAGSAVLAACAFGGAADARPPVPGGSGSVGGATPSVAARPAGGSLPGGGKPSTLTPSVTVEFCEPVNGVTLLIDIYYPAGHTADAKAPAVVYVHGSGWVAGSRDTGEGSRFIPALVAQGYVVFAVDYRLSPAYQFPAHIQDVQCAVRHIRAEAEAYGIDPDRIGAMGGSAGGQLVNLLGTAEDGDFEMVGGYEGYSSEVSAVVGMYGASDFSDPNMAAHNAGHTQVFGTGTYADNQSNGLWMASAVNYVDSGDADFLLLHGEEDPVVPISQSEIFSEALDDAGVDVTFVRVANAGHGFVPSGGTPSPSANQLIVLVVEFFGKHL